MKNIFKVLIMILIIFTLIGCVQENTNVNNTTPKTTQTNETNEPSVTPQSTSEPTDETKAVSALVYLKDNSLYYVTDSGKSILLTDKYYKEGNELDYPTVSNKNVYVSKDGKRVFYSQDTYVEISDWIEFNLYYMDVEGDCKGVLIDKDVVSYKISENGNSIIYTKKGGSVYWSNMNETKEVGTSGFTFISPDGSKYIYGREGNYYLFNGDKEELIDFLYNIFYVSKDLDRIMYYNESGIYYKEEGKTKKKLLPLSDVEIIQVYDTGEMYFSTTPYTSLTNNIYYFDGSKLTLMDKRYAITYAFSDKKPIILFALESSAVKIAIKGAISECNDVGRPQTPHINNAGIELFYVNSDYELIRYDISSKQETVYAKQIDSLRGFTEDDMPIYYTNEKLYVGKKVIANNVFDVEYYKSGEFGIYRADNNDDTWSLYTYSNLQSKKIADDASYFVAYRDDCIFYNSNYDDISRKRDVYFYNGKESVLIDTGVTPFFGITEPTYGFSSKG